MKEDSLPASVTTAGVSGHPCSKLTCVGGHDPRLREKGYPIERKATVHFVGVREE